MELGATENYNLIGLNYPYESGLNSDSSIRRYLRGEIPETEEKRNVLKEYYPHLYREFRRNAWRKLSLLAKIESFLFD